MVLYGVDVARYQGAIDWPAARRAGITFATIKASEGNRTQTSATSRDYFRRQLAGARAAGLITGAYHVVRSGPVAPQVDWYLEQIRVAGADWRDMILQVDYEKWDYDFPSYATVRAFIDELARRCGPRRIILYCGKWIWDQVGNPPANAAADLGVPLWDSHYVNGRAPYRELATRVPASWWSHRYGGWAPTILQYTSTAIVPGVPANCDANLYRGDLNQFRAQFLGAPLQEDDMEPGQVGGSPMVMGALGTHQLQHALGAITLKLNTLLKHAGDDVVRDAATAEQLAGILSEVDQAEELLAAIQAGDPAHLAELLSARLGPDLTADLIEALGRARIVVDPPVPE